MSTSSLACARPTKEIFVIVLPKDESHIYYGIGSSSGYYLFDITGNGLQRMDMPLDIQENCLYIFHFAGWENSLPSKYRAIYELNKDNSSLDISNHPFYISTSYEGGTLDNAVKPSLISKNIGNYSAPWRLIINTFGINGMKREGIDTSKLYFQCTNHKSMGGPIRLIRTKRIFIRSSMASTSFKKTIPKIYQMFGNLDKATCIIQSPWNLSVFYITEQTGYLVKVNRSKNTVSKMLDLKRYIGTLGIDFETSQDERGLLSVAVHSQMKNTFFIYYTTRTEENGVVNRLSKFKVTTEVKVDGSAFRVPDEEILIEAVKPSQTAHNHNGGCTYMDELTNTLYLGIGDGGNTWSSQSNGFYGKILKISITKPIDSQKETLIYAKGFRNPWGITGLRGLEFQGQLKVNLNSLIVCDVGLQYEEINLVTDSDQNFGWPIFDGPSQFFPTLVEMKTELPRVYTDHTFAQAFIGGHIYLNKKYPLLYGEVSHYI